MRWQDPTKCLIFGRILYFQEMCFSPVCFLPGHRKGTISVCSCGHFKFVCLVVWWTCLCHVCVSPNHMLSMFVLLLRLMQLCRNQSVKRKVLWSGAFLMKISKPFCKNVKLYESDHTSSELIQYLLILWTWCFCIRKTSLEINDTGKVMLKLNLLSISWD